MGEQSVRHTIDKNQLKVFTQHLFNDIKALEIMIENGMIEEGVHRIGAEQELCLIDSSYRPAPLAMEVLANIQDEHFTTELSKFNLEINLDPQSFTDDALSKMESQLRELLDKCYAVTKRHNVKPVLVGILPTIRPSDLSLDNITPVPRYYALNDTISRLRGGPYEFRIQGTDELIAKEDTFMFESCNNSFQVHYQLGASEFIEKYNWAQAISGPVLASCTNSPFMLGKRLWRETRIAIFQQATDTRRSSGGSQREMMGRVFFGNEWVSNSVADIFKEDVARFRVLVSADVKEDSVQALQEGRCPKLKALRVHNGTIYKWNRACYGITNGKPHLRIENRLFPSGPTVLDEMANTALWLGLMHGMPEEYGRLIPKSDFDNAKTNFFRAAKNGMGAMFRWINNKVYSSQDLINKELLPIARDGLKKAGIQKMDIDRYMEVIQERVETGISGSQWMLDSFASLKKKGTKDEALVSIAAAIANRQDKGKPVHTWKIADILEAGSWINRYWRIEQIMSTNLYTVLEDDLVDLIPNIMTWKNINHLPVENEDGKLVGIITSSDLVRYYSTRLSLSDGDGSTVKEAMIKDVITISPESLTMDAISIMRKHQISCLPVVNNKNELVGLVTERDFVNVADHFLQEFKNGSQGQPKPNS